MNFETARHQMLAQQIRAWNVLDDRVLEVLRATPREAFVPDSDRDLAFADTEIPIGHGQAMMNPMLEGRLLQELTIDSLDSVLEIGTGSGYLTACLGRLAASVHSVEIFSDLSQSAAKRVDKLGIRNANFEICDAFTLQPSDRQYDVVAITGSLPALTEHFIGMLKPHGRLFAVVGHPPAMEARLITVHSDGTWSAANLFETVLAPLVNAPDPEPFVL